MASIKKRPNGKYRARYRDATGREHARHFTRKTEAQRWLDEETASLVTGTYVNPKDRKVTVDEWCDTWIAAYEGKRPSTVRQGRVHLARIRKEFGPLSLAAIKPSAVRSWLGRLQKEGLQASYVYALHNRLSQVLTDAVHDGLLTSNPCSRRTSPGAGKPRPYVATTEQVWQLYEAFDEHYRLAVLLGAFAGLRVGEVCGLRRGDVAFDEREIRPAVQYPAVPLKTEMSREAIPVPDELVAAIPRPRDGEAATVLVREDGEQPSTWAIERQIRAVRGKIPGLPEGFRFHDLRHYYASLLIASGADVKVVQHRLRHSSAKTTLDTYGHLWPDSEETTRAAVGAAMKDKIKKAADPPRTGEGSAART
ncbi:tyrosine recombinase XerC [Streptomyces sp. WAC05950]|uniref:site-specific integrase n=1 Tax=Streptomyces sp. WAC05950 TaxID=2487419 RepID=UPI000F7488F7|nr:site-specific integrase [Streptomyces sp. WAC05950]RST13461.1 site-specific integrase [Streptomyces sp. WAC05950]